MGEDAVPCGLGGGGLAALIWGWWDREDALGKEGGGVCDPGFASPQGFS